MDGGASSGCGRLCGSGSSSGGDPRNCDSGVQLFGVCLDPTCTDGVRNSPGGVLETGVDCGPACSNECPVGTACAGNGGDDVCTTGICDTSSGQCAAPTCRDGRMSPAELGETASVRAVGHSEGALECGGSCGRCPIGTEFRCNLDTDCESLNCQTDAGVGSPAGVPTTAGFCAAPSCANSKKDGQETDWNCGGPSCDACADGRVCERDSDCIGDCVAGRCKGSSGTGLSCGFGTSQLCAVGDSCEANSHLDCASGFCRDESLSNGTTVRRCSEPPATGGGSGGGGTGSGSGGGTGGGSSGGGTGGGGTGGGGTGGGGTPVFTCPMGNNTCGGTCSPCPIGTSGCISHGDCAGLCLNAICSADTSTPDDEEDLKTAGEACRRHSEC